MGYGPALAAALGGAGGGPPPPPADLPLPAGPPIGAPPPMPMMPAAAIAPPQPSAQGIHEAQSKKFLHAAITDYHRGGITRGQLADAVADQDAYDYENWKKMNVVHPTRASEHNVAIEEPAPIAPPGPAMPAPI